VWRAKGGDIILYVEEIYDQGLRTAGGFEQVSADMVLIESCALRNAKKIDSAKEKEESREAEVANG
jgi:hypothetical protein